MLQLTFTKTVRATGEQWTLTLPTPPADFMAEYDALTARMGYGVDMGWKQSLSDSFAGATTKDEFESGLTKKAAAFIAGTIRAASTVVRVVKTPLEQMVLAIAAEHVDRTTPAGKKRTAAEREALIEFLASVRRVDFTAEAETRLNANKTINDPAMMAELEAMGLLPSSAPAPTVIKGGKK